MSSSTPTASTRALSPTLAPVATPSLAAPTPTRRRASGVSYEWMNEKLSNQKYNQRSLCFAWWECHDVFMNCRVSYMSVNYSWVSILWVSTSPRPQSCLERVFSALDYRVNAMLHGTSNRPKRYHENCSLFCPFSGALAATAGLPLPLPRVLPPPLATLGFEAGGTGRGGVGCSFCRSCAKWKSSCSACSSNGIRAAQRGQT